MAALPMAVWLWQFTVDDAFISARYAHHLAEGVGHRFNRGGPVTDGVTPLGYAHLLAPFGTSVLSAHRAAKVIGLLAWLAGAASLGLAIDALRASGRERSPKRLRMSSKWLALGLIALSAPLGAWSVAGMETGIVMALGAGAASARVFEREGTTSLLAGLAAGWRPEALPWAIVLALAPARRPRSSRQRWAGFALAVGPALVVATIRQIVFGRPAPLALYAKPSDLVLGGRYALAAAILTGVVALLAYRGLPPWIRGMQLAVLAHFVAIALAGGDWMPLSRLAVTALPTLVVTAAFIAQSRARVFVLGRMALAYAGLVFAAVQVGPRAAEVGPKRMLVIESLRDELASHEHIAALDIGWLGATTDADILDLAGVTDPAVAMLPGGHTSKRIPPGLLSTRGVDALVLRLADRDSLREPWTTSTFVYWVDAHVASMPQMAERFRPLAASPPPLTYLLLAAPSDSETPSLGSGRAR